MALTDGNGTGMVMPVGPMYGNGGFDGFGGGDGWWVLLFLFALMGNGGWGGFGNGGFNNALGYDFPWLLSGQNNINANTNEGFQNAMLNDNITSVRDGISGLATQMCNSTGAIQQSLCNGFATTNATINGGFANAETAANARQMANMQQAFAGQVAMSDGFNQLGSQFANCCCENRLGIADLKYTVATENCADRAALSDGIRDIIASNTASTQRILDQLCQDKIDAKNDTIAQLRQELIYARGQASQIEQTAILRQGQEAEVDALYNRLSNCPVPTTPVYGRTPIFTCNNNSGCGCNNF